jgi:hypothetical protein
VTTAYTKDLTPPALPQQQLGNPMPGPHQIAADGLAGPHQIPCRLLLKIGHDHLHNLIEA